jgi:urease accessory protein UreE
MFTPGCLRYPVDVVLDDMLRGLGLSPTPVVGPFEPEAGAYIVVFDAAVGRVGGPWIP